LLKPLPSQGLTILGIGSVLCTSGRFQAFNNLATVLRAAGSDTDALVKTTVFLADANEFAAMNALYTEFFPNLPPARSTPVVTLPRNLLISIECIALV
jgi:2-iminobutanoate/2-iminopropanoate deaminase